MLGSRYYTYKHYLSIGWRKLGQYPYNILRGEKGARINKIFEGVPISLEFRRFLPIKKVGILLLDTWCKVKMLNNTNSISRFELPVI